MTLFWDIQFCMLCWFVELQWDWIANMHLLHKKTCFFWEKKCRNVIDEGMSSHEWDEREKRQSIFSWSQFFYRISFYMRIIFPTKTFDFQAIWIAPEIISTYLIRIVLTGVVNWAPDLLHHSLAIYQLCLGPVECI